MVKMDIKVRYGRSTVISFYLVVVAMDVINKLREQYVKVIVHLICRASC